MDKLYKRLSQHFQPISLLQSQRTMTSLHLLPLCPCQQHHLLWTSYLTLLSGLTLTEALDQNQVKKTKFYNQRYIAELSVVYEQLLVDPQQALQTATRWTTEKSQSFFPPTDWSIAWLDCHVFISDYDSNFPVSRSKTIFPIIILIKLLIVIIIITMIYVVIMSLNFAFTFPLPLSISTSSFRFHFLPVGVPPVCLRPTIIEAQVQQHPLILPRNFKILSRNLV